VSINSRQNTGQAERMVKMKEGQKTIKRKADQQKGKLKRMQVNRSAGKGRSRGPGTRSMHTRVQRI
jgi:hypothetical protein